MTDNLTDVAESAAGEWDNSTTESDVGDHTVNISIPCQLHFTDTPEWDTGRFHDALDVHGYSSLDSRPADRGPTYDGEVCSLEHYNRVDVLVFRGEVVRLYPLDNYVPAIDELSELLHALSVGAKSSLTHEPIDGGDRE